MNFHQRRIQKRRGGLLHHQRNLTVDLRQKINPAAAMGYLRTLPICYKTSTAILSENWDLAKMKSDDTLIYRRHSDNINAQQYISAMLEAEDDF
jgi:hypothetical protein